MNSLAKEIRDVFDEHLVFDSWSPTQGYWANARAGFLSAYRATLLDEIIGHLRYEGELGQ